ncbi:monocarboxylate transporter 13-like [Ptychodera flava]|uniref:monocarboxylate transporter 13-like n=1 Tax=Ptychodera flava TaxID=63121 RepID=UPI00396A92FD
MAGEEGVANRSESRGRPSRKPKVVRSVSFKIPEGPPLWWKLVIICCNFVIMFFCLGLNYGMWYLVLELQEFFDEYEYVIEGVQVKWIVYINIFMTNVTAVFASWLAYKVGHRVTAVSGAILSTTGLFVSGFTRSIEFLCVSYGIFTGIGFGLLLTPSLGILARYFEKRYTFVNAVTFLGSSLCIVLFPPLLRAVKETYGRKAIFFIVAGLNAQSIWLSLLYKPFEKSDERWKIVRQGPAEGNNGDEEDEEQDKGLIGDVKILARDLFCKNPIFVVVICSMFLIGLGHSILVLHFASVVKATGSDIAQIDWCMLAFGLSMILGQIGHGAISTVKILQGGFEATYEFFMFGASQIGVALVAMFSSIADTFPGQVAMASLIGFCSGIYLPLMIVILEFTSHKSRPLTTTLGLGLPVFGIGALIGLPIGDVLNSKVKYNSSYFLAGAAMMLSAIIMIYVVVHNCCRTARKNPLEWSNSVRRNSRPIYRRSESAPVGLNKKTGSTSL